ncbi:MAG: C4-dicarboxylate ABC transporter substrate-binding protein [Gammaproteobacteria bacterium]|nr:C4-dicarboxylate ABC transporter substrate-binding protein [Gammaproteobacteria bacterium]
MKIMTRRSLLILAGVGIAAAMLWMAVAALRPLPERSLTLATGPDGSAYAVFGKRYRDLLARQGVEVRLVATDGSIDNAKRLQDPGSGIDAAFVQAGTTPAVDESDLLSLGTLFYEPLWVFCRCEPRGIALHETLGTHVAIGPEGSASRALALRLMQLNRVGLDPLRLEGYSPDPAAEALLAGRIDTAIIDTAWESPAVQRLLADPSINLVSFPRAEAYVALLPFLSKVVLPMGVANLAGNRPPTDIVLIAPKASLVVRRDLHPALQYLLIDAATRIHGGPGIFNGPGAFPAPEMIDIPLSDEAQHMYRSGPSFLRRHLPFWLAELAQRLLLLIVPLLGVIYPVVRFAPDAWRWRQERRLRGMYRELRRIERGLREARDGTRRAEWLARLDDLEARAALTRLSDAFAAPFYELKQNIRFVQERYGQYMPAA